MKGILISLMVLFLSSGVLADCSYGYCGMMYGSYGSGYMIFGWIFTGLIALLVIILIFWLVREIIRRRE